MSSTHSEAAASSPYVVVARRYRPQTFTELVGQEHVAESLRGAIEAHRVGHAYLFTGARGVGKTSSARILAKCLNCVNGPTISPCGQCEACQAISTGDDVDVLEIDGASNRGIDEIRELRQKVNVRPSRARYKIYIIDEVHMLTREAFNALLKTLEEPPEHVKFIFCTTEAEKIPITILSRCQRFDFAGIHPKSIIARLKQIAEAEGVTVEEEALELLARRAAGSMRDSQSLLEQLLACCGKKVTGPDVHRLLGTAGEQRLEQLVINLVERNAAAAIANLDQAVREGVDIGQLIDQLLGYLRDLMVASVGATDDAFLYVSSAGRSAAREASKRLGLDTILAAMQILEQALARMRVTTYGRTLAELALVRVTRLEDLEALSGLIGQLRDGTAPAVSSAPAAMSSLSRPAPAPMSSPAAPVAGLADSYAASKKNGHEAELTRPAPAAPVKPAAAGSETAASNSNPADSAPIDAAQADNYWRRALATLGGDMTSDHAGMAEGVAILAPNRLVATFRRTYTSSKVACERPEVMARIERALAEVSGHKLKLEFDLLADEPAPVVTAARVQSTERTNMERLYQKSQEPFVQRAVELFRARPTKLTTEPG